MLLLSKVVDIAGNEIILGEADPDADPGEREPDKNPDKDPDEPEVRLWCRIFRSSSLRT